MTPMTMPRARRLVAALACGGLLTTTVSVAAQMPAAVQNIPSALSAAGPLLSSIGSAVPGLSQAQSILGAGSLLGLAKAKMPADQFSQVSKAIPGADALIGEAVKQGLPSGASGLAAVTEFLGKSGVSASQVTQMVPALTGALKGKVTPEIASAFASALQ